ncbi:hypothetical protein SAMN05444408_11820 [Chryseobacterium takakiae]|uniref:Uncharacterized protein n=1 Tax=Chryseobacterium takakiae TaxID=1302685 RepID=A0A1M5BBB1_9FLAO|nr:hypothetical protein SAMN05444408_11820 [Chryseobacterium takakiae]
METKEINPGMGLITWQVVILILVVVIIYFLYRIFKKRK